MVKILKYMIVILIESEYNILMFKKMKALSDQFKPQYESQQYAVTGLYDKWAIATM